MGWDGIKLVHAINDECPLQAGAILMADILLASITQQCNNINNDGSIDPQCYTFPDVEGEKYWELYVLICM